MPFIVEFDIPNTVFLEFQDKVIWEQIKELSAKDLKRYLFKFVRSKGYTVVFRDLSKENDPGTLGLNYQPDHKITLCSTKLSISELPSVVIHECFHSIFNQLENEDYIELLEKKVLKALTITEANRLLREVFKRGNFIGPIAKQVGTPTKSRKSKTKTKRFQRS